MLSRSHRWMLPALLVLGALPSARAVTLDYQTKSAGLVSLGLYDGGGHLRRTLQSGKQQEAGAYKIEWDGRDDAGQPCAAGPYQLRGAVSKVGVEYQLVAGNPGDPPYFSADGTGAWNGHWGNPLAVCADAGAVYMQFSGEEGAGSLLKLDFDGRVQWKAHLFQGDGNGSQLAAATDGQYVYIAADNPVRQETSRQCFVWRVKADSGEYANWNGHGFAVGQPYEEAPVPFWEFLKGPRTSPPDVTGANGGANVRGLAVRDNRLYVPLYREDKIEVWDVSGAPKLAATLADIAKPQGIAVDGAGNLYVASGKTVLKVAPDGKRTVAVAAGLVAPYGVAVDVAGSLYVTDLGKSQQVKKFSRAGALLWASGKAGGRPWSGQHEPANFLMPAGLAVTANGRLFVGENAVPRRSVILASATGKLWQELMGTLDIGAGVGLAVDEADPSNVYIAQPYGSYLRGLDSIVRYQIDYAKKTWRVDAYWAGMGASVWQNHRGGLALSDPRIIATGGSDYFVRHRGKYTYLCSGTHLNHGIWRVDGYRLTPAAAVGSMSLCLPADLSQGFTLNAQHNLVTSNDKRQFAWHDTNGDGLASADEVTFWQVLDATLPMHTHGGWGAYFDQAMNLYYPDEPGDGNLYKVPCTGTDARGNPLYDWSKVTVVVPAAQTFMAEAPYGRFQPWNKEMAGQTYRKHCERVKLDAAGNVFGTTEIMGQDQGIGWASSTLAVRVGGWDAQGNLLWLAGSKAKAFAKPGQFYTGKGVDGALRGFAFFTDENGQSRVYSGDGLYIGSLLEDMYRGPAPGPDQVWIEYCGGRVFTHPRTGDDYLLAGDGAGLHFWKIVGLKAVQRLTVPVTLSGAETPPAAAGTQPAVSAAPGPTQGWEIVESAAELHTSNLYGIAFGSPLNGAVVGEGPVPKVSYSADGGVTWRPAAVQATNAVSNAMDVLFTGPQTAWATGIGMTADNKRVTILLKSLDGGAHWQEVALPPEVAALNAWRVWFAPNNQDGYVLPYSYGALAKTTDGGQTWKVLRYPNDPALEPCRAGTRTTGLHAFDTQHLLVTTSCGLLLQTRDGGASWQVLRVGAPDLDLWAVSFAGEGEGWVAGAQGLIMHTADGGATWARQESGFTGTLERVQFVSALEGYAVAGQPQLGVAGALLHTTDGGRTWRNINPAASSLRGLFLLDAGHGWACGGRGGSGGEPPIAILRYCR